MNENSGSAAVATPGAPPLSVGDAVKGAQTGQLPIGTVEEILKRAPSDLIEDVLEVPEWACSVKVKSFTAAQSAEVKQRGLAFKGEDTKVAWAEMLLAQGEDARASELLADAILVADALGMVVLAERARKLVPAAVH